MLKFAPAFPQRFGTVGGAREFMATFVEGYNQRLHSGIGLNTAADVHYGLAAAKTLHQSATLAAARARNPERFTTTADPKILALPGTTWINKPPEKTKTDTESTTHKKLAA